MLSRRTTAGHKLARCKMQYEKGQIEIEGQIRRRQPPSSCSKTCRTNKRQSRWILMRCRPSSRPRCGPWRLNLRSTPRCSTCPRSCSSRAPPP
eukprot:1000162-Pyramimonas_sp.AAC.1